MYGSTMEVGQPSQYAVEVSGVFKTYGTRLKKITALQDLNMVVPRGAIYGLLGPSGCGKTTLLRCIVGRLQLNGGHVLTLGNKPGAKGHLVPGKMVGYMPQELALYNEFTIGETLAYFSRLNGMTKEALQMRMEFLLDFLNLPEENRIIKQLSGGQQRRTSFACALLHEPELLILDEPTVGVDPLLRMKIWEHLLTIAKTGQTTIIITTHYVEEARQAHMVGLMREGRLLAEAPPLELMEQHSLPTLEDVFLKLCENDQIGAVDQQDITVHSVQGDAARAREIDFKQGRPKQRPGRHGGSRSSRSSGDGELEDLLGDQHDKNTTPSKPCCGGLGYWLPNLRNIWALAIKNLIIMKRQIGFLMFEFLLPSFQIILFCTCVGRMPYNLNMSVVNNETCVDLLHGFSCLYLQQINNRTVIQDNYTRLDDGIEAARQGRTWGAISIGANFSTDLINRMASKDPDNATIDGSTIHLYLDMTNQQIAISIQQEVLAAFEKFVQQLSIQLPVKFNPATAQIPIKLEEPIYGELNPSFTNFMAPGIILSITFFMATGLTALFFVLERKQGLMDRSFVAGVSAVEIMIAHISTQFLVMVVQVALLLIFALAVFKVPYEGSLVLVVILTLLQGLTGMALGLLISCVCEDEMSAIQAALGSVYPNMLLSGIIWPIESMPVWLRYFSYSLPMTFAAEAMRCILARGWGLLYTQVWRGFVMSIGWGWLLMVSSGLVLRFTGDR